MTMDYFGDDQPTRWYHYVLAVLIAGLLLLLIHVYATSP
jgi:hypothetical protein